MTHRIAIIAAVLFTLAGCALDPDDAELFADESAPTAPSHPTATACEPTSTVWCSADHQGWAMECEVDCDGRATCCLSPSAPTCWVNREPPTCPATGDVCAGYCGR